MDKLIKIELSREDWEKIASSAITIVELYSPYEKHLTKEVKHSLKNLRKLYFTIKEEIY